MGLFNKIRTQRRARKAKEDRRFNEMLERVVANCMTEDEVRRVDICTTKEVLGQTGRETVLTNGSGSKALIMTEFNSGEGVLVITKNGTEQRVNISSASVDFREEDYFNISYTIEESEGSCSKIYDNSNFITSKREDENGNIIYGIGAGSNFDNIIIEVIR